MLGYLPSPDFSPFHALLDGLMANIYLVIVGGLLVLIFGGWAASMRRRRPLTGLILGLVTAGAGIIWLLVTVSRILTYAFDLDAWDELLNPATRRNGFTPLG